MNTNDNRMYVSSAFPGLAMQGQRQLHRCSHSRSWPTIHGPHVHTMHAKCTPSTHVMCNAISQRWSVLYNATACPSPGRWQVWHHWATRAPLCRPSQWKSAFFAFTVSWATEKLCSAMSLAMASQVRLLGTMMLAITVGRLCCAGLLAQASIGLWHPEMLHAAPHHSCTVRMHGLRHVQMQTFSHALLCIHLITHTCHHGCWLLDPGCLGQPLSSTAKLPVVMMCTTEQACTSSSAKPPPLLHSMTLIAPLTPMLGIHGAHPPALQCHANFEQHMSHVSCCQA